MNDLNRLARLNAEFENRELAAVPRPIKPPIPLWGRAWRDFQNHKTGIANVGGEDVIVCFPVSQIPPFTIDNFNEITIGE